MLPSAPREPPFSPALQAQAGGGGRGRKWAQPGVLEPKALIHNGTDSDVTGDTFPSSLHPLERTARVEETLAVFGFRENVSPPSQAGGSWLGSAEPESE